MQSIFEETDEDDDDEQDDETGGLESGMRHSLGRGVGLGTKMSGISGNEAKRAFGGAVDEETASVTSSRTSLKSDITLTPVYTAADRLAQLRKDLISQVRRYLGCWRRVLRRVSIHTLQLSLCH